jgi:hypothetical protein
VAFLLLRFLDGSAGHLDAAVIPVGPTLFSMMDVVYIGLTAALVLLTWGLVRLFERVA